MKIAYLVNQYPQVSHSFIRREIGAIERLGIAVRRYALRGWDAELADPADLRERERTQYVLRGGTVRLMVAAARQAVSAPLRFITALGLTLRMGRRAHRPLPYHFACLAEACWLVPRLRAAHVQHLHAHFGTNPAEVAMLVNALCNLPYSFTVHGTDELDRPEAIKLGEKIRRAAFVAAVSSHGRSQLIRWVERAHWPKVKVVRCGLEPGFFAAPGAPLPAAARLVCVGRLSSEKGQFMLLEAAARLARDGIDFELVLAGDGELRRALEATIEDLGLADRVRITGWLSGAAVRAEILAARALVVPSLSEGLPVVIMEALALNRPVVASCVAGVPELVVPGENGWLVPAGAADELAAAMKSCIETPVDVLTRMGARGRERVRARHDVDREAALLAALFRHGAAAAEGGERRQFATSADGAPGPSTARP